MSGKKTSPGNQTRSYIADDTVQADRVHLRPILGIRAGYYLFALYAVILALVLFFVLLFPGLSNPGTVLMVQTEPYGAAIRVDGVYQTAAPAEVFIPRGRHTITIALPGFAPFSIEKDIQTRIFGSLFFPLKDTLTAKLTAADTLKALIQDASEYAQWSFAGEPNDGRYEQTPYEVPLTLSEGVYRYGAHLESAQQNEAQEILKAAARFASNRGALRDLVRAQFLKDSGGAAVSPFSALHSIKTGLQYLNESSGAPVWLAETLPSELAETVFRSDWYNNSVAGLSLVNPPNLSAPQKILRAGGLTFIAIPAGTVLQSRPFARETQVPLFSIAQSPVNVASWDLFLEACPDWKAENREDLARRGLVDSLYLDASGDTNPQNLRLSPEDRPISAVSWYAATAYCEWLSGLIAEDYPDMALRLPTETEWEYAAKTIEETFEQNGGEKAYELSSFPGLRRMLGGYWEWCADLYAPLNYLAADEDAINAVGSPERSVRGGSWVNASAGIDAETRGSLPPESCSPFVSFRPILVQTGTGNTP